VFGPGAPGSWLADWTVLEPPPAKDKTCAAAPSEKLPASRCLQVVFLFFYRAPNLEGTSANVFQPSFGYVLQMFALAKLAHSAARIVVCLPTICPLPCAASHLVWPSSSLPSCILGPLAAHHPWDAREADGRLPSTSTSAPQARPPEVDIPSAVIETGRS